MQPTVSFFAQEETNVVKYISSGPPFCLNSDYMKVTRSTEYDNQDRMLADLPRSQNGVLKFEPHLSENTDLASGYQRVTSSFENSIPTVAD